jgi:hypothetical protein
MELVEPLLGERNRSSQKVTAQDLDSIDYLITRFTNNELVIVRLIDELKVPTKKYNFSKKTLDRTMRRQKADFFHKKGLKPTKSNF